MVGLTAGPAAPERLILVEQSAAVTAASFLAWVALVTGRCAVARAWPAASWAAAAAAVGGAWCAQAMAYEVMVLVLVIPWIRDLFAAGWRVRGLLAVLLLAAQA